MPYVDFHARPRREHGILNNRVVLVGDRLAAIVHDARADSRRANVVCGDSFGMAQSWPASCAVSSSRLR